MIRVDDTLLQRMTAAIVETAGPERMLLFGSRARDDAVTDSDIDLVVLEAQPFGSEPRYGRNTSVVCAR